MNLFKRFNLIINASVNEMIDRVEDPTLTIKHLVRDMESNLVEAKEQVVDAILHEKQLLSPLNNEKKSESLWLEKATTALQQDQEAKAREALQRKQTHSQLIESISASLSAASETTTLLKSQLLQLESKLIEVKLKQSSLQARENALSAQKRMGLEQAEKTDQLNQRLDKMDDSLFDQEARLAAMEALERELNPVENAILDLKQDTAIDHELEQLKQSLNADK